MIWRANLSWQQARALALDGVHVRRASWTGQWIVYWRGLAWLVTATESRVVEAADWEPAHFSATDWTTIPHALTGCRPPDPEDPGDPENPGDPWNPDNPSNPEDAPPPNPPQPPLPFQPPLPPGPPLPPQPPIPVIPPPLQPPEPPRPPGSGPGMPDIKPPPPPPPPPDPPPGGDGCHDPSLSVSPVMRCDGTIRCLSVEASLSGGTGQWSVKFSALGQTKLMGMADGDGGSPPTAELCGFDCMNQDTIRVTVTATGFGECGGRTVTAYAEIECTDCEDNGCGCTDGSGCCPGEDGHQCGQCGDGTPCCCCPSYYAPNGVNCECVYVG